MIYSRKVFKNYMTAIQAGLKLTARTSNPCACKTTHPMQLIQPGLLPVDWFRRQAYCFDDRLMPSIGKPSCSLSMTLTASSSSRDKVFITQSSVSRYIPKGDSPCLPEAEIPLVVADRILFPLRWTEDFQIRNPERNNDPQHTKRGCNISLPYFLVYIWSKTPPSAKCSFWAFVQPPKVSSIVNSLILGNCLAYLAATFASVGR